MRAAVLKEVGILEVQDVPEPEPAPDQIKVKIAYCGICGTDPEIIEGRFGMGIYPEGAIGKPPQRLLIPPGGRIMGHEASGTIVEVGKDIRGDFKKGQQVAMNFRSACGACYYCNNMMEHFCEMTTPNTGAMAEYALYQENTVFPLPEDISLEAGAFLEPVSVAVHTLDIAQMKVGDSVIITGAGAIGLLIMQLAIRSGASKVLVSEPFAEKRNLARELGADVVVDPLNEDLLEAARKLTDGRGFDVCFEASGKPDVARQLILLAEGCGTIVWAAVYPTESEVGVPIFYMYQKELSIRSVKISPYSFPRSMQLLPKLNLKPLITVFPLDEAAQAFEAHKAGRGIKIMLKP
ncbi:zinc-binding dehydrogenase [Chloroflexota bacterium]